ncbi:hypothetical protein H2198_000340 [Neophaeococcomyces mojaviensis]|uniref:Uncharacterized protein n=1 Tax=Neophaeococcomyces mojaviensis TaxID=3383035 RepID=A0ACC3AKP3_9EURO|nr:hypothetical protein H2198_000340 [Knufia sp. JES_112]
MYLLFGVFLLSMVVGTGFYITRNTWFPLLPDRVQDALYSTRTLYTRLPTSTSFMDDVESGFTSSNFDLAGNVMDGDSRAGLDQKSKQEVMKLMKSRGISFDEARALHTQRVFKKAGIGADGLPNDPKLVTFGGR